jgi:hypothetical protein
MGEGERTRGGGDARREGWRGGERGCERKDQGEGEGEGKIRRAKARQQRRGSTKRRILTLQALCRGMTVERGRASVGVGEDVAVDVAVDVGVDVDTDVGVGVMWTRTWVWA